MPAQIKNFKSESECVNYLTKNFNLLDQYAGKNIHYITSTEKTEANFASQTIDGIGFHNDGYDCGFIPEYVALYCIEDGYENGETLYSDFEGAWQSLTEKQQNIISGKDFFFQTDPAIFYKIPGTGVDSQIVKDGLVRYSYAYIKRLESDVEFNRALDSFNDELIKNEKAVKLKKGDLLIFDNRSLFHGRNSFFGTRNFIRFWLSK